MLVQGEHRRRDDTGAGTRVGLLKAGGEEEETIEPGEITYRFKIATNKHYSCNSENCEKKFSKETFHFI